MSSALTCAISSPPVVRYGGTGPHHSIHLVLDGSGRDQFINEPVKPSRFAVDPPCGPRLPFFSAWVESDANVCDQPALGRDFVSSCTQLEQEWLDMYQTPYDTQHKYCGRGEKPRYRKRPALPPPSVGGAAHPPFAVSLRWFAARASTILTYLRDPDNSTRYRFACTAARKLQATADRSNVVGSPFSDINECREWAQLSKVIACFFAWF